MLALDQKREDTHSLFSGRPLKIPLIFWCVFPNKVIGNQKLFSEQIEIGGDSRVPSELPTVVDSLMLISLCYKTLKSINKI